VFPGLSRGGDIPLQRHCRWQEIMVEGIASLFVWLWWCDWEDCPQIAYQRLRRRSSGR
jgi:hypothetical protein